MTRADPVFVYGALRSGTTVFRLMLDAHPGLSNCGEVDFLLDYLERDPTRPDGWRYRRQAMQDDRIFKAKALDLDPALDGLALFDAMIDQLASRSPGLLTLNIHRHIDRLLEILPEVRLIHLLRDPRDVARSSIGMGWAGTLYHGVDHWMKTEAAWDRVAPQLDPAQVCTLRYEDLFRNVDHELARVCEFLGVAPDPAMLRYHENTTYEPPDPALVEQWRRKSTPAEIALVEGKARALMTARGYEPTGPGTTPGPLQALRLWIANKRAIWRTGIERYGAGLWLAAKVSHRLRLTRLHRRLRARIDEKALRYLK